MVILFVLLGLFQQMVPSETSPAQELIRYKNSPIAARQQLREGLRQGLMIETRIRNIVASSGDHSLDGLAGDRNDLLPGLHLQDQALALWKSGRYAGAVHLYQRAYQQFGRAGAISEAAFCLYYISEVLAEQERFVESLGWNRRALEEISGLDCILLSALLWESRGYATWFVDNLSESVQAFSKSLKLWNRTGYRAGIAAAWNNLAALFEEVGSRRRAEQYYRTALATIGPETPAEVRFHLNRNFALFLSEDGRDAESLMYLRVAEADSETAPLEYRLAASRIRKDSGVMVDINPPLPRLKAEAAIFQAELLAEKGDHQQAERVLRRTLEMVTDNGNFHYRRRLVRALGLLLENRRRYAEAATLYIKFVFDHPPLPATEILFPLSDIVSPFLKGWIRCQVRLGRPELARRGIHTLSRLREKRARQVLSLAPAFPALAGEIDQIVHFEPFLEDLPTKAALPWKLEPPSRISVQDLTILEAWPDGKQVFLWLDTPNENIFLIRQLETPVSEQIDKLLGSFFDSGGHLPALPAQPGLNSLAREIILPLKNHIPPSRLLILAHQELQNLPFEMLPLSDKQLLIDRYIVSYLPSLSKPKPILPQDEIQAGLILAPEVFEQDDRATRGTETDFLRRIYPGTRVVDRWDGSQNLQVPWVHISSHFKLGPHFWISSRLDSAKGEQQITELLNSPPQCRLLSLAVCDSANSYLSGSPYWLGFGELFLLAGAGSLVASRWKLDQFAVEIFEDLFAYCRQGMAIDEAVTVARNRFRSRRLRRGGIEMAGNHPFFWAGISFVGWPNSHLFRPSRAQTHSGRNKAGFVLVLLSVAILLIQRRKM